MVGTAAHLVEHVLPEQPIRQWVLSFPYALRFLFATRPAVLSQVLGIVYRAISTFLIRRAPSTSNPTTDSSNSSVPPSTTASPPAPTPGARP